MSRTASRPGDEVRTGRPIQQEHSLEIKSQSWELVSREVPREKRNLMEKTQTVEE